MSFEKPYLWNYESNLTVLEDVDLIDPTAENFTATTDHSGSIFRGWFVAPATTRYRFAQSCDEECSLSFSATPDNKDAATDIIAKHLNPHNHWYVRNKRYYNKYAAQKSAWIDL